MLFLHFLMDDLIEQEQEREETNQKPRPKAGENSNNKSAAKDIITVVFRNKIYKIHKLYPALWHVYDFHTAPLKDDCHLTIMSLDPEKQTLSTYEREYEALTYDIFTREMQEITDDQIPEKFLECILNIQRTKIAKEVSREKILEHEAHHLAALRKDMDRYVNDLVPTIYAKLSATKIPLEKFAYPYIFYENKISNKLKILYKHPNADGKMRPTFYKYVAYLFDTLYPMTSMDMADYDTWVQYVMCQKLTDKYPYLTIEFVGYPNYIEVHLPHKEALH
jgi:hypothetical protein